MENTMDTKSFIKILRRVIREEVRIAINDVINESPVTDKQVIDKGVSLHNLVETNQPVQKTFVKNSMLNDILNETAATADFRSMHNYSSMDGMMYSNMANTSLEGTNGEHVDASTPELQAINKAINRDYSGLMKQWKKTGKGV
jgi:hypothetical protein